MLIDPRKLIEKKRKKKETTTQWDQRKDAGRKTGSRGIRKARPWRIDYIFRAIPEERGKGKSVSASSMESATITAHSRLSRVISTWVFSPRNGRQPAHPPPPLFLLSFQLPSGFVLLPDFFKVRQKFSALALGAAVGGTWQIRV